MLHSYTFCNYQSFREWTTVSLVLGGKSSAKSWTRHSAGGEKLTTALAVFGANASGKTALLKPLGFASWFMVHSFSEEADSDIPLTTHFASPGEPFQIAIEAEDEEGQLWRYILQATQHRVVHEALYQKKTRFSYVFIRDWNEESESYDIKQQGFGFAPTEARKVRRNASLISTAAQYGVDVGSIMGTFGIVASNVNYYGRRRLQRSDTRRACEFFSQDESLRKTMVELIRSWDLGISDIEIREVEVPDRTNEKQKEWEWSGVHRLNDGREIRLQMEYESSGTQSAVVLLSKVLVALSTGGVALIDEMESDLHPHLVLSILDLFAMESTNPYGAQIIFTCHSLSVLDRLQKAQVIFVERTATESSAYRGDEIQGLRSDDNLRAKYESGALGALPRT